MIQNICILSIILPFIKQKQKQNNMKAILEFNLDEMEDQMSHLRATKSTDLALALWEIKHNMKHLIENSLDDDSSSIDKQYELLDKVREFINVTLEEHGIIIDDLIN